MISCLEFNSFTGDTESKRVEKFICSRSQLSCFCDSRCACTAFPVSEKTSLAFFFLNWTSWHCRCKPTVYWRLDLSNFRTQVHPNAKQENTQTLEVNIIKNMKYKIAASFQLLNWIRFNLTRFLKLSKFNLKRFVEN